MPHLWRMNKYHIPHLSPFWGSLLAGTILGAWIYQYWGSAEGYIWGKPVGKVRLENPKKKAEAEKTPDSLYANPDEDEQQLNGSKHNN